jgi:hypothetical protein
MPTVIQMENAGPQRRAAEVRAVYSQLQAISSMSSAAVISSVSVVDVDVCDEDAWPDKVDGLVCGECAVLVDGFTENYGGSCRRYCASVGRECAGGWQPVDATCEAQRAIGCGPGLLGDGAPSFVVAQAQVDGGLLDLDEAICACGDVVDPPPAPEDTSSPTTAPTVSRPQKRFSVTIRSKLGPEAAAAIARAPGGVARYERAVREAVEKMIQEDEKRTTEITVRLTQKATAVAYSGPTGDFSVLTAKVKIAMCESTTRCEVYVSIDDGALTRVDRRQLMHSDAEGHTLSYSVDRDFDGADIDTVNTVNDVMVDATTEVEETTLVETETTELESVVEVVIIGDERNSTVDDGLIGEVADSAIGQEIAKAMNVTDTEIEITSEVLIPTTSPTAAPTTSPTASPTTSPTAAPSRPGDTPMPTASPTGSPTASPTTASPTLAPTTAAPTTASPTASPTTPAPTSSPTVSPTASPTAAPTIELTTVAIDVQLHAEPQVSTTEFTDAVLDGVLDSIDDADQDDATVQLIVTEESETEIEVEDGVDVVGPATDAACAGTSSCSVSEDGRRRRLSVGVKVLKVVRVWDATGTGASPATISAAMSAAGATAGFTVIASMLTNLGAMVYVTTTNPDVVDDVTGEAADDALAAALITATGMDAGEITVNSYVVEDEIFREAPHSDDDSSASLLPLLVLLVLLPVLPVALAALYAAIVHPGKVGLFVQWRFSHSSPNFLWRYVPEERRREMRQELDGGRGLTSTIVEIKTDGSAKFTVKAPPVVQQGEPRVPATAETKSETDTAGAPGPSNGPGSNGKSTSDYTSHVERVRI